MMDTKDREVEQYVGYGMIGTPDGFQNSCAGAREIIDLVQQRDLTGEGARSFHSEGFFAESDSLPTLYCMQQQYNEQIGWIDSIAQYHPFRQKGSYRSDTYLGAFIGVANASLGQANSQRIFEVLKSLVMHQLGNFVDFGNKAYTKNLAGNSCPPVDLKGWEYVSTNSVINSGDKELFIPLAVDEDKQQVFKLLQAGRYTERYSKVYFSSHSKIIAHFQKIPSVDKRSIAELRVFAEDAQVYMLMAVNSQIEKQQLENEHQRKLRQVRDECQMQTEQKLYNANLDSKKQIDALNNHCNQLENEKNELNDKLQQYQYLANMNKQEIEAVLLPLRESIQRLVNMAQAPTAPNYGAQSEDGGKIALSKNALQSGGGKWSVLTWGVLAAVIIVLMMAIGAFALNNGDAKKLRFEQEKVSKLEAEVAKLKTENEQLKHDKTQLENELGSTKSIVDSFPKVP
ncbi:hypothetical protein B0181_03120 [Moraxella caviae]|uniref:Uncharacterized protein n=3 Tax=Moraxella caviae TaxID=34060 RepID=A0A1T0A6B2_9GAMM|nr:bZIP transcription factor [Moraxella caviae]OOR91313.1 hypothetical protein B0181_03120 [Moraxella caviae]